jgi:hypothetical protein
LDSCRSYNSGEEIRAGDRILYHDEPGEIEFVADPLVEPHSWYVIELGGGVMIKEPKVFGSVFVSKPADDEDLIFQRRATE